VHVMGQAKRAYKLAFRLQGRSVTTAEPQGIFTGGYALLISYGERVISLPDSKATDNTRKSLSDKLDSGFCYSVIILLKDLVYIYIEGTADFSCAGFARNSSRFSRKAITE
jgi:hypothetical protein